MESIGLVIPISTVTGLCSISVASLRISSGMVAENKSVWRFSGNGFDNAADGGQKAHVKHVVCFVQYQDFNIIQVDDTLVLQIQQASRAGDHNIDTAAQALDLRLGTYPAVNGEAAQAGLAAELGDDSVRLFCQFAGWGNNQGTQYCRVDLSLGAAEWAAQKQQFYRCRFGPVPTHLCRQEWRGWFGIEWGWGSCIQPSKFPH